MRIRITSPGGYHDRFGRDHAFRAVVELPDAIAVKLIHHNIAVAAPEPDVTETAAVSPPRNAARRTSRPKPRRKAVKNGSD